MKEAIDFLTIMLAASCSLAQGTFLYDQQSSTDEATPSGNTTIQQITAPYGQSFTPTLSAVDFIRLKLSDRNRSNATGATLFVNLRTGSVNGTILSSTGPVFLSDNFVGTVTFLFPNSVPLTPGSVYYFQPLVQSGDLWNLDASEYNYSRGSVFVGGFPALASDYWFREGIIIPEPSSGVLLLVGTGFWLCARRRNVKKRWNFLTNHTLTR
jgi:hypothetical protein